MSPSPASVRDGASGFALVLIIILLGLLVVVTYALAILSRVDAQAAATASYRTQAKQHALGALAQALGELQARAGPDDRLTGMAGITGVLAGRGRGTRQWCGVWSGQGVFLGWLVSGARPEVAELASPSAITILGEGALGTDGADREHVRAGLLPVLADAGALPGTPRGRFAWWVADEGVKLSAVIPDDLSALRGARHALDELIPALDPDAPLIPGVESFEQLAFVPADPLPPSALQANRHAITRTHLAIAASPEAVRRVAGTLNVNSTSVRFWRGVAATYNRGRAPGGPPGIPASVFAQRVRDGFTDAQEPGKQRAGPFQGVESFLASDLLAEALRSSDVSPRELGEGLRPWLAVRSDTFRVRAYGEAGNASEGDRIEAAAWCEAILQRTMDELPGHGRRFIVTRFRWLGPDEI